MALPIPLPSSAWYVTTFRPFSPKMSTKPSCILSANPGYFCADVGCQTLRSCLSGMKWTYVVQRAVCSDRAALLEVAHFAHDRRDATCAEPRSPSADQLCECAEELTFGKGRLDREKVGKDTNNHQELVRRVAVRRVRRV